MKYPYKCEDCKADYLINKPICECGREEFCQECDSKKPLLRIYNASSIKTNDGFKGGK